MADEPIRILHLSDLHFTDKTDYLTHLQPLIADIHNRDGGLGFDLLDYLVISGDLTDKATPEQLDIARQFVSGVIEEFGLSAERTIIAPGNHDLSWTEKVYDWEARSSVEIDKLPHGSYCIQGDVVLTRDDKRYPNRFHNFSEDFYHPLMQKEYPLAFAEQCVPTLFEQTGIQFITLNSCWEIDEWFPERASIFEAALARGLKRADEDIKIAREAGRLSSDATVLRIGVWHHPVTGNDKIKNDAFVEQLRQANVMLCLHGHVHEDAAELIGYMHPRKVRIAGAGSFGAVAKDRPESTPRLYNLLEIARDHSGIKVHTRHMVKKGGAWGPHEIWPADKPGEQRSYYTIPLV